MSKVANLGKQQKRLKKLSGIEHRRNDALFDFWSLTHIFWGISLGWLMDPFIALAILVLWEPLEILILSPLLKRYFNVEFGFETLRNSLSDIVFDVIGIVIGYYLIGVVIEPPFLLLQG